MTDGYYVDPAEYTPAPPPVTVEVERVSPRMRAWRTAVQAFLAFLASLPPAVALLPADKLPESTVAWVLAIPPALTVIISAVWNVVDERRTS